ncbi:MAG: sugar-transfer associated ATP-grasp domain-containing protein [Pseudomonadota bacterium]
MTFLNSKLGRSITRARQRIFANARDMVSVHDSKERSVFQQVTDIIRLKLHGNGIQVKEYFSQGLFRKDVYPGEDLASFGGLHFKNRVHSKLNDIRWEGMVTDKLIQYSLLRQFGIPHPEVIAAACHRERKCGDIPVFTSIGELARLLRHPTTPFPLYCKPVKGYAARDISKILRYEQQSDALALHDGRLVPLFEFLGSLETDEWGFLFQEAAEAPQETKSVCGDAVSGCRVIMLLDNDKAHAYRATWKIPRVGNIVDNYVGGSYGNLICDIDIASGLVNRVVSGAGLSLELNKPQPDTGFQLLGMKVPQWDEMLEVLSLAAPSFPGFRWQHWDIGITAKGPMVFELNSAGSNDLLQLSSGRGINDRPLQNFLGAFEGGPPPSIPVFSKQADQCTEALNEPSKEKPNNSPFPMSETHQLKRL